MSRASASASGLGQLVDRHGLAREGADQAGHPADGAQHQALQRQVVDAGEELVALAERLWMSVSRRTSPEDSFTATNFGSSAISASIAGVTSTP